MKNLLKNPPESDGRFHRRNEFSKRAYAEAEAIGCPSKMLVAFLCHVSGSRLRGISFEFTLTEWWNWWQTDDRWLRRGRGGNQLVMGRFGDIGPYRLDNIYCVTGTQNIKDVERARRIKAGLMGHETRRLRAIALEQELAQENLNA